jgi:hypothetical protein
MEIPYRDSTVFAGDETASGGPENILAEDTAEEPISRESAFAGLNTEGESSADAEQTQAAETVTTGGLNPVLPPSNEDLVQQAIGTQAAPSSAEQAPGNEAVETAAVKPLPEIEKPEPAKAEPAKVEPVKVEPTKVEPASGSVAAKAITPGGSFVQVASVRAEAGAAGEFKKLQAKFPSLSGLSYRTQEANLGAKGTFFRIQAGPMSKDSANQVCASIKSGGGSCLVVTK